MANGGPDDKLYAAIVKAEAAAREAHDLCYDGDGHGASYGMKIRFGRAQSIFMTYVTKFAKRRKPNA